MSTTIINHNGSHFAGEKPDTLEELYAVLRHEPLDPAFEATGNFVERVRVDRRSMIRFWGNFFAVSHGFSIDTDDDHVISMLSMLIKENQKTPAYLDARDTRRAEKLERLTGGAR